MTFFLPFDPTQAHPAATSHADGAASLATPPAGGRGECGADTPLSPAALRQAQDERIVGGGPEPEPQFERVSVSPPSAAEPVPTSAEGATGHTPVFSPQSQAKFLDNLSINGNVRHACKVARVSPQTAYRARRKSPALAKLWDAALLSARDRAEEELATRAMNGTEESVFYHGEEVATRTRYSDRLLLAHLARLDRLAERADVSAALHALDDAVDALKRGEDLENSPFVLRKRSCDAITPAQHERGIGDGNIDLDTVPSVPSCRDSGDEYDEEWAEVVMGDRLLAMDKARPANALYPHELAKDHPYIDAQSIEDIQLMAFEDGEDEWWLVVPTQQEWEAALTPDLAGQGGEGVSCAPDREGSEDAYDHDADGERRSGDGVRAADAGGSADGFDRQV